MKNKFKLASIYKIVMLISMFALLNSCSKNEEVLNTETLTLNTDKSQYASYEIVTISANDNLFIEQSFTAKINGIDIIVGSNENIASFVLPDLTDGNYNLSFTINQKNYIVPIKVIALSNIFSADQYFNEVQTSINQNITDLNSQITQLEQNSTNPNEYLNLHNDVIKFTNLLNYYSAAYANLSTEEKQEFAKAMAANKAAIDEYNNLTAAFQASTVALKSVQSVQDYETIVEFTKVAYLKSITWTVAHIPLMIGSAKLMAMPTPWVKLGGGVATGILFTSYCINLDKTITLTEKLAKKSIKPFEFILQSSQAVYDSGVETDLGTQAKYRPIIDSDSNGMGNKTNVGNGSTITTIAQKYNYFKNKYNGFINELPAIFRPSYIMPALNNTYNTTTTRSIFNLYVSITNVSNPKVTLQQLNQADGSIKIKATTSENTDQTFTYDVNYTNSNFTSGLKKTVSATVNVLDLGQNYQGGLIGYFFQQGEPGYIAGGQHGIIVSANNLAGIQWYNGTYIATGANDVSIGAGKLNTEKIVTAQGNGSYAAKVCYDLILNNYNDWFLPSKNELNMIYVNRNLLGNNFVTSTYYHSSTESGSSNDWCQEFATGGVLTTNKLLSHYLRPVRYF